MQKEAQVVDQKSKREIRKIRSLSSIDHPHVDGGPMLIRTVTVKRLITYFVNRG